MTDDLPQKIKKLEAVLIEHGMGRIAYRSDRSLADLREFVGTWCVVGGERVHFLAEAGLKGGNKVSVASHGVMSSYFYGDDGQGGVVPFLTATPCGLPAAAGGSMLRNRTQLRFVEPNQAHGKRKCRRCLEAAQRAD